MHRKGIIKFLSEHFRYYTMNSWNLSTSYAQNLKVYNVIPREFQDRAYELINVPEFYEGINDLPKAWEEKYDHTWQVGFNGRSGGYLVLYSGGYKLKYKAVFNKNENRTYSDYFGRWITREEAEKKGWMVQTYKQIYTHSGRGVDQEQDFEESSWGIGDLRDRYKLVKDFDQLCQDIIDLTIQYCKDFKVVGVEFMVPKKIKVLEAV